MSEPTAEPDELSEVEIAAVFQRTMASVTEQAGGTDQEGNVMEALFPVFFPGVGDDDGENLGL